MTANDKTNVKAKSKDKKVYVTGDWPWTTGWKSKKQKVKS